MKKIEMLDLLSAHADALNRGVDDPRQMLMSYPEAFTTAVPLLLLAEVLKATLTPIRPRDGFKSKLAQQLSQAHLVPPPPKRRRAWLGAAAIGSLLSLTGLILLLVRFFRSPQNPSQPVTTAV